MSVDLFMRCFNSFSASTGLYINPDKCYAYYGGVADEVKQQIHAIAGIQEGILPFRYLGVPLTSRKLSVTLSAVD